MAGLIPGAHNRIAFPSSTPGVKLSGILSRPQQQPFQTGVMLLSGSGPQDCDESIAGQRPFHDLAELLVAHGCAVFRWDDRGVGDSQGDYLAISADDLVADVGCAIQVLKDEAGVSKIVLIGHSQGCLIATKVVRRWPKAVTALILLAGAGRPGREVLVDQHRRICEAEGIEQNVIDASAQVKDLFFDILEKAQQQLDEGQVASKAMVWARQEIMTVLLADESTEDQHDPELEEIVADLLEWEWRFLLSSDPALDLREVDCPVLALVGGNDTQVNPQQDISAVREALFSGGNQSAYCRVLPKLNHLFQYCESGRPGAYEQLGPPWAGQTKKILVDWLASR